MKVINAEGKLVELDVFFDKKATKGRPRKILTDEAVKLIESLSRIMCTEEEIATILGAELNTLKNADNGEVFDSAIKRGRQNGKASLRRQQYQVAMKGNVTMLIWLGKQWLGQSEKVEQINSYEDLTPLRNMLKIDETEEIRKLKDRIMQLESGDKKG